MPRPQGLTWDGENLWICDEREDRLARISTADGTTITQFPAPFGYPQGLAGTEIPLVARIIAIADTLDAITTDRPYRERSSLEEAVNEIENNKGTQFDPVLVDAVVRLFRDGRLKIATA